MNWVERARREIATTTSDTAANTVETNPTAVTAVQEPQAINQLSKSNGSNDSTLIADFSADDVVHRLEAMVRRHSYTPEERDELMVLAERDPETWLLAVTDDEQRFPDRA